MLVAIAKSPAKKGGAAYHVHGEEAALAALDGPELPIAPDLVVAEVANAAWKLARAGEINEGHGSRIATAIATAFADLVPAARLVTGAYRIARSLQHPVYDCLYLRLAELESTQLLSADARLLRKLEGTQWQELGLSLDG